ncbi:MAG: hypothetical protein J2P20_00125 [Pseudonocardia sp.]|nr:hypothetical protein [Pseudonocardia sp.]
MTVNTINKSTARRLVVGVMELVPEALAAGFLTSLVAEAYGLLAGVVTFVALAAGRFAAPLVADWARWRRFRPAGVAAPVVAHLQVDLDAESAAVVDTVAETRDVTAPEVVRRALRLLADFEGVAPSAGVDVDPEPVAAEDVSNYVQVVQGRLRTALPVLDTDLVRLYALVALVKGTDTTAADVHDAWSVWRSVSDPRHPNLVPSWFLSPEVEALDAPIVDAVRLVAASVGRDQR